MARKAQIVMTVFVWLSVLPLVIVVLVIAGIGQPAQQIAIYPDVGDHLESLRKKVEELSIENAKLREETRYLFDEAKYLLRESTKSTSTERNKHPAEEKPKHETPALPTGKHERHVRKVGIDVRELGYYVTSRLEMSAANLTQLPDDINRMTKGTIEGLQQTLHQIKAYIRTALADLKAVSDPESDWRRKESEYLGKIVREKIHQIMNPENCEKKKKFICDLRANCGFGCQFHHVIYCMVTAIYHRRPIILLSSGWTYSGSGWEKVFRPISDSCLGVAFDDSKKWRGDETDHDAIIPVAGSRAQERLRYLPLAIPEELAPRLTRLHGNPGVWWIGQLATYLWNFQPQTSRYVDEVASRIGFKSPIVGIHVRRTDKIKVEASAHFIHEYMTWVDEYYNQREMTEEIDKRRVFIATDDATVVLKARRLYPHYEILNDMNITMTADTNKRYSPTSLLGLIADIDLLARSDFLVCTFSSNVCRLAYELLQAKHGDASQYFHSLDDIYYFGGQRAHQMTAIEPHVPDGPGEIALSPGDKILIAGNHWDGYSKGKHSDEGKAGLFLSYKVEDAIEVASYPYRFLPPDDGDNDTVANPT